ncbi:hypothetical protein Q4F19_03665 [Sphingomonas sp. BIUV-7]|uniref:Cytochrome c domain-containing protein n=1 Tax=Sphingomonas natans TaxID=3063330 RepID=A0ABT8Y644_9SPHN|nr:hypothetical protein [Sphingomonas sp. BIUV-7]MDO6413472.1 hypothetical protein [Sphingomonas sp. BIUV-7]
MRAVSVVALLLVAMLAEVAAASSYSPAWDWAFPPSVPPDNPDTVVRRSIPGSLLHFTEAQTRDLMHAVDWQPADHAPMPESVAHGTGGALACGFCHLPTGHGRPENSALAGLPAAYIEQQVKAFADGTRRAAKADHRAALLMAKTAQAAPPEAVRSAALYFSRQPFVSRVRVVEAETIPHPKPFAFVYAIDPAAPPEPLGQRIIEAPANPDDFELRDPRMTFTAYVPRGAVAEGAALAKSGGAAAQPCTVCHGPGLRGGIAPPLAGRSPTTMARQLIAFQTGARANAEAAPMRLIAARLTDREMIALSAYAATLKP